MKNKDYYYNRIIELKENSKLKNALGAGAITGGFITGAIAGSGGVLGLNRATYNRRRNQANRLSDYEGENQLKKMDRFFSMHSKKSADESRKKYLEKYPKKGIRK
jgi:hypothetical protein